jgi:hypothetical protein
MEPRGPGITIPPDLEGGSRLRFDGVISATAIIAPDWHRRYAKRQNYVVDAPNVARSAARARARYSCLRSSLRNPLGLIGPYRTMHSRLAQQASSRASRLRLRLAPSCSCSSVSSQRSNVKNPARIFRALTSQTAAQRRPERINIDVGPVALVSRRAAGAVTSAQPAPSSRFCCRCHSIEPIA